MDSSHSPLTYDVFISYNSDDRPWIRSELVPRLEKSGLKVCVDYRDFRRGEPTIEEIERSLRESHKALIIITPEYLATSWIGFERLISQTRTSQSDDLRLIPMMREKSILPRSIRHLTPINFTSADPKDRKVAWKQVLSALGAAPASIPNPPPARDSWWLAHPYAPPPMFVGRQLERDVLTSWLNADHDHPLMVMQAMGGVGKSSLAWHWLMHDVSPSVWPSVVWWSFYEGDHNFETFVLKTLGYLKGEAQHLSPRQQVDKLLNFLQQPGILLVLDGFERALQAYGGMNSAYQGEGDYVPIPPTNAAVNTLQHAAQGMEEDPTRAEQSIAQRTGLDPQTVPNQPVTGEPSPTTLPTDPAQRDSQSALADYFLRTLASEPAFQGKVLLVTRLTPRAVEAPMKEEGDNATVLPGCHFYELGPMQLSDAIFLLAAQGVRGEPSDMEYICGAYHQHPLSLSLLSGLVVSDISRPGDITAIHRLDISGDLEQRWCRILEESYQRLTNSSRQMLNLIACSREPISNAALLSLVHSLRKPKHQPITDRWPVVKRQTDSLAKVRSSLHATLSTNRITQGIYVPLCEKVTTLASKVLQRDPQKPVESCSHEESLDSDMRELMIRGLAAYDPIGTCYGMHPIVRHYVYQQINGTKRADAHNRLRDYFSALPPPVGVQRVEDLSPIIERYHHTVRAGHYDEAFELFYERINKPLYYQFGAYERQIELLLALFSDNDLSLPRLSSETYQAWTLNALANCYGLSGQPQRAIPLLERAISLTERQPEKKNLAIDLANLAYHQMATGKLYAADSSLTGCINIYRSLQDEFGEADGHQERGRVLAYCGRWEEAAAELTTALTMFERWQQVNWQSITWAYRALQALLLLRTQEEELLLLQLHEYDDGENAPVAPATSAVAGHAGALATQIAAYRNEALEAAQRALELTEEFTRRHYAVERDYVRSYWLLGAAHRVNSNTDQAYEYLNTALTRCRQTNMIDHEAEILLEMAKLRAATSHRTEARQAAEQARAIAERSNYVLQGADIYLFLASLAHAEGDRQAAQQYAQVARSLAAGENPSSHVYRVALGQTQRFFHDSPAPQPPNKADTTDTTDVPHTN